MKLISIVHHPSTKKGSANLLVPQFEARSVFISRGEMMRVPKLTSVVAVFTTLILSSCWIGEEYGSGGTRKDMARMLRSVAKNAIGIALTANGIRTKMMLAPAKVAFYKVFTNTKKDYREELESTQFGLKSYLSSTPEGSEKEERGENPFTRSNRELHELAYSIQNMNDIVSRYRNQLLGSESDVDVAVEYYTVQYECFVAISAMNREFVTNIDERYDPSLRALLEKLEKLAVETRESDFQDGGAKKSAQELLAQQEKGATATKTAIDLLQKQREWSANRQGFFDEQVELTRLAMETAIVLSQVRAIITEVQGSLDRLAGEPLPLVIFEADMDEYLIQFRVVSNQRG